jgi:hypothetical protein
MSTDTTAKATPKKSLMARGIQGLFGGEFLAREGMIARLPFIGFLAVLLMSHIALMYSFENSAREKNKLQSELNELRSQYNTTLSALEKAKQQSEVAKSIEAIGLRELSQPPTIIEINSSNNSSTSEPTKHE